MIKRVFFLKVANFFKRNIENFRANFKEYSAKYLRSPVTLMTSVTLMTRIGIMMSVAEISFIFFSGVHSFVSPVYSYEDSGVNNPSEIKKNIVITKSSIEHFLSPNDFRLIKSKSLNKDLESNKLNLNLTNVIQFPNIRSSASVNRDERLFSSLLAWNPEETFFEGRIKCSPPSICVSVQEATKKAVENGFPTREEFEALFLARQKIFMSIGRLLPRFEITLGPRSGLTPLGILDCISSLFAFLLPSNWFDWKESKLMYEAERYIYLGILQDQVSNTEILYYNIHQVDYDLLIYNYYIQHLQALVDEIKVNFSKRIGQVTEEQLLQLEQLLEGIKGDAAYLDTVIRSIDQYDLAVAMGRTSVRGLGITSIDLPDLSKMVAPAVTDADLEIVKKKSSTLMALRYLRRASDYNKYSRIFSFLSAGSSASSGGSGGASIGISIGFDYIANIEVSKSNSRSLDIRIEQNLANIENIYLKNMGVLSGSIDIYKYYMKGKEPNRALFRSILKKYEQEGVLDVQPLINAISFALKFELSRNFIQHYYLTSESIRERLLLIGDKYKRLSNLIPSRKELRRWHDRHKRKEDKEIDRDLEDGVFDLKNP